jgi:uncharacterized protein with NRDE domain
LIDNSFGPLVLGCLPRVNEYVRNWLKPPKETRHRSRTYEAMCTVVILRRPGDDAPLVVGANRDEMRDRPWLPPARHWPERPGVVAGLDRLAGGTWMGLNDDGVVAAVLNRDLTLGPAPGKRSRGELPLRALEHRSAADAAGTLARIDPADYRPFNLVIADAADTFWLAHRGEARIAVEPIPAGLSMLTALELNDAEAPRIVRYRERFLAAKPPSFEDDEATAWRTILADTTPEPDHRPQTAMRFRLPSGFQTVSSTIVVVPAPRLHREPRLEFGQDDGPTWAWRAIDLRRPERRAK